MLNRSEVELERPAADKVAQEDARELTAEQRWQQKQRQQSMLNRSEAEVGIPGEAEGGDQA